MTRVKKGVNANKTRRNVLKAVKGYQFGRSTKEAQAREAIAHAGQYALNDRRKKKGVYRGLWITRLNAALRKHELSYSKFIDIAKKKGIILNRKVLSEIAKDKPESFERLLTEIK